MNRPPTISGRFNEILGSGPVKWDDSPTYFNVPTSEKAPAIPPVDEAATITRQFAAAAAQGQQRARQQRIAQTTQFFNIPIES